MEIDWEVTNLKDLLLYDNWRPFLAIGVLAGFDFANFKTGEKVNQFHLINRSGLSEDFYYEECYLNLQRLNNLWESTSYGSNELNTPSFFINWALSKKFEPDWLEWAISKNFYTPEVKQPQIEVPDLEYETELLRVQRLAISEFFNPRRNVDAKKEEVKLWVKDKGRELDLNVSDNVAEAIFTIIKPRDHNPKIKRG
jgi:hypothetical protein